MLRLVIFSVLLVASALSLAGTASARIPIPVGVCVSDGACYGGHDVCVSVSEMVPACADSPLRDVSCSAPSCPPPSPCEGCIPLLSGDDLALVPAAAGTSGSIDACTPALASDPSARACIDFAAVNDWCVTASESGSGFWGTHSVQKCERFVGPD